MRSQIIIPIAIAMFALLFTTLHAMMWVDKGLEVEIQQAMDVLQVIRRNPGQEGDVDLRDETAIATRMLESLKEILERRMLKNREEK